VEHLQPAGDDLHIAVVGPALRRPARHPRRRDVVGDGEVHHGVGGVARQHGPLVGPLGLRQRAREPVEDVATTAPRGRHRLAHDVEDEVVRHQLAGGHVAGHVVTERRARRDLCAQEIAAGHVVDAVPLGQPATERPLPRTWRTEQYQSHQPSAGLRLSGDGDNGEP
jgi:hypothetical protein